MTTRLEKPLKREVSIGGEAHVITLTPQGLELTRKGPRKGVELGWEALIDGDAALAAALNASLELRAEHARPRGGHRD